jgi:hypothetical protein
LSEYYFVAVLHVLGLHCNPPDSPNGQLFGEFAVTADRSRSLDLGTRFPAEGLLRALDFATGRPVKQGAALGQALQTLRFLTPDDQAVLQAALQRLLGDKGPALEEPFGLWTKCERSFADYFLTNWRQRRQLVAFLLYDPPPTLAPGAPVFVHSDKVLRLIGAFHGAQYVAGYKPTVTAEERLAERERVWRDYRAATLEPPSNADFDAFWDAQHGVRGLFLMDHLAEVLAPATFKDYGRALGWGYPMGVGYRYLTLAQCYLLLRAANLAPELNRQYLSPLLESE